MNPTITTAVYILLIVIAISIVTYMILYTRSVHAKKSVHDAKGRAPVSREEGITVGLREKERAAHAGKVTW